MCLNNSTKFWSLYFSSLILVFMSFTLKGWCLPHHLRHFLPRKNGPMSLSWNGYTGFGHICILSLFDPPLTLLDRSPTSFKSWKACILYQKNTAKKWKQIPPPPKKVTKTSFCWSSKFFVGVTTLETDFNSLPFSYASFAPKLEHARSTLRRFFPKKKTGQKSPWPPPFCFHRLGAPFRLGKIDDEKIQDFSWHLLGKIMGEVDFVPKQKDQQNCSTKLHPWNLTWNLRITQLKRKISLPNLHFQVPC